MRLLILTIFFLPFVHSSQGQAGVNAPWTWIKGDNVNSSLGNYGIMGVEHPSNEPIARSGGSSFTGKTGELFLFGGSSWFPAPHIWYFNDLWKFNPSTNNWTWINGSNQENGLANYGVKGVPSVLNRPGSREQAVEWVDADGNFWIFGGDGYNATSFGALNDLWKYDVLNNTWTWISGTDQVNQMGTYGPPTVPGTGYMPGPKYMATGWADEFGNLWLFGGADRDYVPTNEVWRYRISTNEWTWMKGSAVPDMPGSYGTLGVTLSSNTPSARTGSAGWVHNNEFYLFGGMQSYIPAKFYNDIWKYSPATNNWTWIGGPNVINQNSIQGTQGIPSLSNNPGARQSAVTFTDLSGHLWMFGGFGYNQSSTEANYLNDLWKLNPVTNEWTWMKGGEYDAPGIYGTLGVPSVSNRPGGRQNAMGWSHPNGSFYLFGGYANDALNVNGDINDLWTINSLLLLPVRLISFTGIKEGNFARLYWEADGLTSSNVFTVERSLDGRNFNTVGYINAIESSRVYHFNDPLFNSSVIYYRLKILQPDQSFYYSNQVLIRNNPGSLSVYPNPSNAYIQFDIENDDKGSLLEVIDVSGRSVFRGKVMEMLTGNTVRLEITSFSSGNYHLRLVNSHGTRTSSFVKL